MAESVRFKETLLVIRAMIYTRLKMSSEDESIFPEFEKTRFQDRIRAFDLPFIESLVIAGDYLHNFRKKGELDPKIVLHITNRRDLSPIEGRYLFDELVENLNIALMRLAKGRRLAKIEEESTERPASKTAESN